MNIVTSVQAQITSLSTDTIIILIILGLSIGYTFYFGKDKIISLILSFYLASFIYENFYFINKLIIYKSTPTFLFFNHLTIFLIFFFIICLFLNKIILIDHSYSKIKKIIHSILLGGSFTGLVLLGSYHIISIEKIYNFSPTIDKVFYGANEFTIWLIVPFVVFLFVLRR